MDIRVIHADDLRKEIGYVNLLDKYDAQASIAPKATLQDNTWELIIPTSAWQARPIQAGHFVYIAASEWGGPVERIAHSTRAGAVTLTGPTWRGMLSRKIIEPPTGNAYMELSGEANAVISAVVGNLFGDLFQVSGTNSGITISGSWRYTPMLDGLQAALSAAGAVLNIQFDSATRKVVLSARMATDHSDSIDLSQDYGIDLTAIQGRIDAYNHVIALGAGELLDRDILHVYRLDDGSTTTVKPAWADGLNDIVTTYEYSNAETMDDLVKGAEKRLIEYAPLQSIEIDPGEAGLDLPLGDIVGGRDRVTGLATTARVLEKILTLDGNGVKIDTKVG